MEINRELFRVPRTKAKENQTSTVQEKKICSTQNGTSKK